MTSAVPSPLDAHLGFWLRAVSNAVSGAFSERLAAEGVSVAEWVMLRILWDGDGSAPSVLAVKIGMTRGGVTKLADKLIAKGLVHRQASPEDGRAQTLALTPAGRALTPGLAALADANDAAFFGALPAADRETLERLLRQIVEQSRLPAIPID
ncbi:MAG: winged helix-turn-helix transcriptional regulator [Proteobacteria bacterium]|nr:winged helix-turn-helix transcriptional regulator [Pseudomonadota bacterium]